MLLKKMHKLIFLAATLLTCATAAEAQQQVQDVSAENSLVSILSIVNQLPTYLTRLANMATSFLASDYQSSDPIPWKTEWDAQNGIFNSLTNHTLNNKTLQVTTEEDLIKTFFGISSGTSGPQNVNDLSYLTLLGTPLASPDPRGATLATVQKNYLINTSSLGITYMPPAAGWRGPRDDQRAYTQFYNSITSVQTYNAHVLSELYQDSITHQNADDLRTQLKAYSSDPSWFSAVIANDLGWVMRQILLFSSQTYLLMDQLVHTQKEMLATLAMTNTLLVANSSYQASMLLMKAQGQGG